MYHSRMSILWSAVGVCDVCVLIVSGPPYKNYQLGYKTTPVTPFGFSLKLIFELMEAWVTCRLEHNLFELGGSFFEDPLSTGVIGAAAVEGH